MPRKVHLVKAMVFPVVMYECECWAIKKAEWGRTDAFELWCWRRLLRVPWLVIRPVNSKENQSRIFIRRTDAETNSSTLATWWEELTHWKRPWCWKIEGKGGEGEDKGWDGWMASPTQWTWVWASSGSWQWTGKPGLLLSMGLQRVRHDWVTELKWTECYL